MFNCVGSDSLNICLFFQSGFLFGDFNMVVFRGCFEDYKQS